MRFAELPKIKKIDRLLGLTGALLWCATILLRESGLSFAPRQTLLLGIMPNFGAFLTCAGLAAAFYPLVFKREFDRRKTPLLCAGILLAMVLSEILHLVFFSAAFDWLDLAAGAVACIVVLTVYRLAPAKAGEA